MRKIFFLLLLSGGCTYAQECGTDELHQYRMQHEPGYAQQLEELESQIQQRLADRQTTVNETYYIPIVVHVINTGGAVGTGNNISNSQITNAIDGMNDRFANLTGFGADAGIVFCLADTDPDGNPTTGIVRVNATAVPGYAQYGVVHSASPTCLGVSSNTLKDLSKWPVYDYYNIWVVNSICSSSGSLAGYATYPNSTDNPYYGMVIRSDYFSILQTTPAHEMGHGLFLYHTFEGDVNDTTCPGNTNCNLFGDRVCDTPPHKRSNCGTTTECSTQTPFANSAHNYMSYCSVRNRFTQNQSDRMRATVSSLPFANVEPCGTLGRTETAAVRVDWYPNPANGKLNIIGTEKQGRIEIWNSHGQMLYESSIDKADTIDISHFATGVYLVKFHNQETTTTKKLIIK